MPSIIISYKLLVTNDDDNDDDDVNRNVFQPLIKDQAEIIPSSVLTANSICNEAQGDIKKFVRLSSGVKMVD